MEEKVNWYSKNSKWLNPIISALISGAVTLWLAVTHYEAQMDVLRAEIRLEIYKVADAVSDLESVIQNRVLTKSTGE